MNWHPAVKSAVDLACALVLLSALAGCKEQRLSVGAPAPRLAAFYLDGRPASLDQWRGKPVYLTFWSSGCGGCAADMQTLQKLTDTYGDRLVVVAVNTDPEQTDIAPFLAGLQIHYPVIRDQLGITKERYQVIGTPTSYLLSAGGAVVEAHQGMQGEPALAAMFQNAQRDKS
ncbi:TlpA family protein disulfide reductase [Acerihabitans arboris]|uniref:Redoxin domain-containing protein n=1 Tax=Acerihabitans arboris TaxID=2691583 RepID=A0A845SQX2_9GAMM|nr:TlpA disulfide reductase family protein [Acerihabitans arboris]NDL65276.1 redoxin domain-containing protein [Acerihabitans arboris]